jgi:glycosyltransferase involved in cell wall biosynthesis
MLSILIPVYNFVVVELVNDLCAQGRKLGIDFEVICLDDCSSSDYRASNRGLLDIPEVVYEELPQNIGRSRIRNRLAQMAKYAFLLFMDCDAAVADEWYLKRYVDKLDSRSLLYGGRIYNEGPPSDQRFLLHWTYGIRREQQSAARRAQQPYHSFMTNNFVVPKEIILQLPFDEQLRGYGHEDTLFGFGLKAKGIAIKHLENPLVHIGLDDATAFLAKSREGISNLLFLKRQATINIETRLLKACNLLHRCALDRAAYWCLKPFEGMLIKNLKGKRPKMRLFDLLKLFWLLQEEKQ